MDAEHKRRSETPATETTEKFSLFEQEETYDADISDKDDSGPEITGRRLFSVYIARKYTPVGRGGGGLERGRHFGGNVSAEGSGVDSDGKARVIRRKENRNDEEYAHDTTRGYEADDEADGVVD
ncbi:hypothetical protein AGABI1DRAFT_95348 [Agaricus bisporus var. burnettii JB137-S8]|uniref:Uncharacterized protein n=2 Tax=Agaricus bisporus var. burnettii TaxID=192524 RepID=A0A8H7EVA0_AGABI|nr:uncharacterized protein AGABI1DRAFT_95348 [Agaricus bisporus var. burnettii JB137-S8]EKM74861.1 hypothetical protein AGABI1DRAFT_95348 [Agaricus bisporus var. burnettii JB137-S8]KAF7759867.1 hypothetical protein Agabi119p4_11562 [Agaricus bisporus var. burnettii]KAF7771848.1 hypothetical protein Agabi119p4_6159 [Agaricus bisporus var. burnettii]